MWLFSAAASLFVAAPVALTAMWQVPRGTKISWNISLKSIFRLFRKMFSSEWKTVTLTGGVGLCGTGKLLQKICEGLCGDSQANDRPDEKGSGLHVGHWRRSRLLEAEGSPHQCAYPASVSRRQAARSLGGRQWLRCQRHAGIARRWLKAMAASGVPVPPTVCGGTELRCYQ